MSPIKAEQVGLKEVIGVSDLDDVTITSADQYDLLQVDAAGEWVDVSNLDMGSNNLTTTGTINSDEFIRRAYLIGV